MKLARTFLVGGILILVLSVAACAGVPGTTTANFLKIGPGAKAAAMGGAYTAVVNDPTSLYWNPAGLAEIEDVQFAATYNKWLADVYQGYVAIAFPNGSNCLAACIDYVDMGEMVRTDPGGGSDGTFTAQDMNIMVGYARKLSTNAAAGITLGIVTDTIDGEAVSCLAGNAGWRYEFGEGVPRGEKFAVGVTLRNLGGTLAGGSLPLTFVVGGAVEATPVSAGLDLDFPIDNEWSLSAGIDWQVYKNLALRVGYRGNNDDGRGFTAGAGFLFDTLTVDYAFVPYKTLGTTHRISVLIGL